MAWKFSYETLLKERIRARDKCLSALAGVELAVQDIKNKIASMIKKVEESRASTVASVEAGNNVIGTIGLLNDFVRGEQVLIKNQEELLVEANNNRDEVFKVFVEANRQVKVLELLKDNRYQAYKKEKMKKEKRRMDDLNIMRWRN